VHVCDDHPSSPCRGQQVFVRFYSDRTVGAPVMDHIRGNCHHGVKALLYCRARRAGRVRSACKRSASPGLPQSYLPEQIDQVHMVWRKGDNSACHGCRKRVAERCSKGVNNEVWNGVLLRISEILTCCLFQISCLKKQPQLQKR
jgi:hypothetical protein